MSFFKIEFLFYSLFRQLSGWARNMRKIPRTVFWQSVCLFSVFTIIWNQSHLHYCLIHLDACTVKHTQFSTWHFRTLEVTGIFATFSVHAPKNLHIHRFIAACFVCLKIFWAVAKLWWFKVWSVESSFIILIQDKTQSTYYKDVLTRDVINS